MLLIFLYLTFPYELLERRILSHFERRGIRVERERRQVRFPLIFFWEGVKIKAGEGPQITLQSVRGEVNPFSLFARRADVDLALAAAGGFSRGVLRVDFGVPPAGRFFVRESMEGIELLQLPLAGISGKVRGTIEGEWIEDILKGSGSVGLDLRSLLIPPIGPFPQFRFDSAALKVRWKGGVATIDEFSGTGEEGQVSGSGTALLRDPYRETILNLSLKVVPREPLRRMIEPFFPKNPGEAYQVALTGTIGRPSLSIDGTLLF